MRISILCSIAFAHEAGAIKQKLETARHSVSLPFSVVDVLEGKTTTEAIQQLKDTGEHNQHTREKDLIRRNWERIQLDDAVLVVNLEKRGIDNYIGGAVFMEIGFAHVLNKKIFLWNDVPDIEYYKEEILAMSPVILSQNIDAIQ